MKELTLSCCPWIKSNDELGNNLISSAVMAVFCELENGTVQELSHADVIVFCGQKVELYWARASQSSNWDLKLDGTWRRGREPGKQCRAVWGQQWSKLYYYYYYKKEPFRDLQ